MPSGTLAAADDGRCAWASVAWSPSTIDDLATWDGGAGLEPVHVQEDVIEVRLPGATGF